MASANRLFLVSFLLVAVLAGCDLLGVQTPGPGETPSPAIPTAANTPAPGATAVTPEVEPRNVEAIRLTVWTGPDVAPLPEQDGGATFLEQLQAFDDSHPDLTLSVEVKTIADQGGILSYLRTGRTVAPSILPDLILLPASQLADSAAQELIYPLDGLLNEEMVEDLYPVARELATVNDSLYGYPFAMRNLQHTVYNSDVLTTTLPSLWAAVNAIEGADFIFPAATPMGAELTLQFYLANGGQLVSESGEPMLESEPLVQALSQLAASDFVAGESAAVTSSEQVWQLLQSRPGRIAQTTATEFLLHQIEEGGQNLGYAVLPGPDAGLMPMVRAWTWAISTPDPSQQALAAELISWLGSSQNLGEWSAQNRTPPGRQSALATWSESDLYVDFLQQQLTVARPFPAAANSTVLAALSTATVNVISGLSTPVEAAAEAITALAP